MPKKGSMAPDHIAGILPLGPAYITTPTTSAGTLQGTLPSLARGDSCGCAVDTLANKNAIWWRKGLVPHREAALRLPRRQRRCRSIRHRR